jgi:WD40 repeat protein/uncharacterized caspase-like protein
MKFFRFVIGALLTLAAQMFQIDTGAQTKTATTNDNKPKLMVQLGHSSSVVSAAISADKRFLVTGGDDTARLWDVATGSEIRAFQHTDSVYAVTFSPDGNYILTGCNDKFAHLWDAATGNEVRKFQGHTDKVNCIAFSADGRFVLTGGQDHTARFWEAATGKELFRFEEQFSFVYSVAFSADGRFALIGTDTNAFLLNAKSGKEIRRFTTGSISIQSVAFSTDGRLALLIDNYGKVYKSGAGRVWDISTGKELRRVQDNVVAFSPDGRWVLTSDNQTTQVKNATTGEEIRKLPERAPAEYILDGQYIITYADSAVLWEVNTGKELQRFEGNASIVWSASVSGDGRFILTGNSDLSAHLWDLSAGKETLQFQRHTAWPVVATFSPNNAMVLTAGGSEALLWDAATGVALKGFVGHSGQIRALAFSADGRFMVTGSDDKTARIWDVTTGKEIRRLQGFSERVKALALSRDGRFILSGQNYARFWDATTGKQLKVFSTKGAGDVWAVAFSSDERLVLTGNQDGSAYLYEVATGKLLKQFQGHSSLVLSVAFSPDGKSIVTGADDVRLWDLATGREIRKFEGHSYSVRSVAFSPDGKFIVSGSFDSTTRIWHAASGRELCKMISTRDGAWVVVDADGRFDTNRLEEIKGLYWIMPDDPFRTLPLEIFMRDYYEPRLLTRILNGEELKPVRQLSQLNRVQPNVKIASIEPQKDSAGLVTVTVEVSKATGKYGLSNRKITRETGVYDVRLFRNGQIVGQMPEANPIAKAVAKKKENKASEKLLEWRRETQIQLDQKGNRYLKFQNVKLPRLKNLNQIEFSAYAFNEDRVKSPTTKKVFSMANHLPAVKGRAYLINIGVNAYESSDWDLQFAANDACMAYSALSEKLAHTGDYAEVIAVPLISDYENRDGQHIVTEKTATRANVKAVMDLLAGKKVAPEIIKQIPNANKIRQARPEDLLIISYSSHGYADADGNFYLFVYDIGATRGRKITDEIKQRCISSEDLSLWLRDVDAGEMVFIVDACYAAGAIEGQGFKPGPMGSRGLGQLAYDKGMKILTASQADDVALESNLLKQGLLTYALIEEGLAAYLADANSDRRIVVDEWLRFGLQRVPNLYEEIKKGNVQARVTQSIVALCKAGATQSREEISKRAGKPVKVEGSESVKKAGYQKPSLFDFAKHRQDATLVRK